LADILNDIFWDNELKKHIMMILQVVLADVLADLLSTVKQHIAD